MFTFSQIHQLISHKSFIIAAELISEIIVQYDGTGIILIDDQFHIMPDTDAGGVDAGVVFDFSEENRILCRDTAIGEVRMVEIDLHLW